MKSYYNRHIQVQKENFQWKSQENETIIEDQIEQLRLQPTLPTAVELEKTQERRISQENESIIEDQIEQPTYTLP